MQACLRAMDAVNNTELASLVLADTRMADLFVALVESATGDYDRLAPAVQCRSAVLAVVTPLAALAIKMLIKALPALISPKPLSAWQPLAADILRSKV